MTATILVLLARLEKAARSYSEDKWFMGSVLVARRSVDCSGLGEPKRIQSSGARA